MDCDTVNWACDGGWMYDAYQYTSENGVIGWDDYPISYVGHKNRRCEDSSTAKERFFNTNAYEEDFVSNERIREIVSR